MFDEEYGSGEESESGDEFDYEEYRGVKSLGIIVLDMCPEMFDDPKPIKKCLKAIYETMDKIILYNYRRDISVCLLQDNDIILTGLNDNIISSIKKIINMLQTNTTDLRNKFERKSNPSLRFVFGECLKQIKNLQKMSPHIIILTVDDDPHKGDKEENLSAIDVALSFRDSNVKLVVLPLKENFSYNLFYGELLKAANDVPIDIIDADLDRFYNSVEDIVEILNFIIKNKVKITRFMFRLFNEANAELSFWTQIRNVGRSQSLSCNFNISSETNNEIKLEYEDEQDNDPNKFLVDCSDERIIIEKQENKNLMSEKLPVGFTLLYLTNEKQRLGYYFSRNFILQNDETVENNSKKQNLFHDLWHYCRSNKKFMICGFQAVGNRQVPHIIEFSPEFFHGKLCFIGQYLIDEAGIGEDESSWEEDSKPNHSEHDKDLAIMCEAVDKLLIKPFNPFQFACYEHELKSSLIKSQLLDVNVQTVKDSFPTNEEITKKLGETDSKLNAFFPSTEESSKKPRKK